MEQNIKKRAGELLIFVLMSVLAGFMIGLGGTSSLLAANLLGAWGKLVGATLFSLGIFVIISFEMKLFTGMVAEIPTMGVKNLWRLPVVFLGNAAGVAITALLVKFSFLADTVIPQGAAVIAPKLAADAWALSAFSSAVLCGFLITLSVWGPRYAPKKGLSASVAVMLPIIVFAFCGFDHSVANMLYFYFLGECSGKILLYILCSVLGNMVGGMLLPLAAMLKKKCEP